MPNFCVAGPFHDMGLKPQCRATDVISDKEHLFKLMKFCSIIPRSAWPV
jgi:hypothetical protein